MDKSKRAFVLLAPFPLLIFGVVLGFQAFVEYVWEPADAATGWLFLGLESVFGPLLLLTTLLLSSALTVAGIKLAVNAIRNKEKFGVLLATLLPVSVVLLFVAHLFGWLQYFE